jgi:hypothetical protein
VENFIYLAFYILINIGKFYLLKFFHKCTLWEIASFAKISKSKKIEKKDTCKFYIVIESYWSNRLLIWKFLCVQHNAYYQFSIQKFYWFYMDFLLHLKKVGLLVKLHQWRNCTNWVKMVFSGSHNFKLRDRIKAHE